MAASSPKVPKKPTKARTSAKKIKKDCPPSTTTASSSHQSLAPQSFTPINPFRASLINKKRNATRPVLFYGVFHYDPTNTVPLSSRIPLTFTATRAEAIAAINRLTYLNHHDHYVMWCRAHGYTDPSAIGDAAPSWQEYMATCLLDPDDPSAADDPEDLFTIAELYYSTEDVVSFFRTFTGCRPLALPHESIQEMVEIMTDLTKKNQEAILDKVVVIPKELNDLYSSDMSTRDCIAEAVDITSHNLFGVSASRKNKKKEK